MYTGLTNLNYPTCRASRNCSHPFSLRHASIFSQNLSSALPTCFSNGSSCCRRRCRRFKASAGRLKHSHTARNRVQTSKLGVNTAGKLLVRTKTAVTMLNHSLVLRLHDASPPSPVIHTYHHPCHEPPSTPSRRLPSPQHPHFVTI